MDQDAVNQVLDNYFQVDPPKLAAQRSPEHKRDRALKSLRIAVQNASSDPSITRQVAQYLRDEGFTRVYRVSPWSTPQSETQVIVQRGDLQGAEFVKTAIDQGTIVPASIGDLSSDVTIRIGEDWVFPED